MAITDHGALYGAIDVAMFILMIGGFLGAGKTTLAAAALVSVPPYHIAGVAKGESPWPGATVARSGVHHVHVARVLQHVGGVHPPQDGLHSDLVGFESGQVHRRGQRQLRAQQRGVGQSGAVDVGDRNLRPRLAHPLPVPPRLIAPPPAPSRLLTTFAAIDRKSVV